MVQMYPPIPPPPDQPELREEIIEILRNMLLHVMKEYNLKSVQVSLDQLDTVSRTNGFLMEYVEGEEVNPDSILFKRMDVNTPSGLN